MHILKKKEHFCLRIDIINLLIKLVVTACKLHIINVVFIYIIIYIYILTIVSTKFMRYLYIFTCNIIAICSEKQMTLKNINQNKLIKMNMYT